MRSSVLLFQICIISIFLSTNFILLNSIVYAKELSSESISVNEKNQDVDVYSKSVNYHYEPFLSLKEKEYKDIIHNNMLSLENFTVASWVRVNESDLSNPAILVNKGGFNSDDKGKNMNYGFWFSSKGIIQGGFETESGEYFAVNSTDKYNDGKWHYILLSNDGNRLKLYVDGKAISTKVTEGIKPDNTGSQPLRIGANSLEEDKFFKGDIDEVQVWNRGLTDNEIKKIYFNDINNSCGQLIYLNFESSSEGSGPIKEKIIIDNKNNLPKINNCNNQDVNLNNTISSKIENNTKSILNKNTLKTESYIFNKKYDIAVTGDWDCTDNTKMVVKRINESNPSLVISTGDMAYNKTDPTCFYDVINPIKDKFVISFGNHDTPEDGTAKLEEEYLDFFNLTKTYYSFDHKNIHFIILDSYISPSRLSMQYNFALNDLKKASNDTKIDWIIAVIHKPLYTLSGKHEPDVQNSFLYHQLFDKYGVDLILQGHNHWYERTFPIKFNNDDPLNPLIQADTINSSIIRNPVGHNGNMIEIAEYISDSDENPVFVTVGTGGRKQYDYNSSLIPYFISNAYNQGFGFLGLNITEKIVIGEFHGNEIADKKGLNISDYRYLLKDKFKISR